MLKCLGAEFQLSVIRKLNLILQFIMHVCRHTAYNILYYLMSSAFQATQSSNANVIKSLNISV